MTEEEFASINAVYEASDVDKDEFCAMWRMMNRRRMKEYRDGQRALKKNQADTARLSLLYRRIDGLFPSYNTINLSACTDILSDRGKKMLEDVGIDVMDMGGYGRRPLIDILRDLGKALGRL